MEKVLETIGLAPTIILVCVLAIAFLKAALALIPKDPTGPVSRSKAAQDRVDFLAKVADVVMAAGLFVAAIFLTENLWVFLLAGVFLVIVLLLNRWIGKFAERHPDTAP